MNYIKNIVRVFLIAGILSAAVTSAASANFRFLDGTNYDVNGNFLYSDIDWKEDLESRGINFLNEPKNPDIYRIFYEAFLNFPDNKKFNVQFANSGFACKEYGINAGACYLFDENTIEIIGDTGNADSFKFVLTHEYAHRLYGDKSTSPEIECRADAFARQYYPESVGIYDCN